MKKLIVVAFATLTAVPVLADETSGVVLAYDRVDSILVLKDKTVWYLPAEVSVPEDLVAGDTVKLMYETAGEDGLTKIDSLERTATATGN